MFSGATTEFKTNVVPEQHQQRAGVFNNEQHAIVNAEIDKLITKGVIVPAAWETGELISKLFLRPKKRWHAPYQFPQPESL